MADGISKGPMPAAVAGHFVVRPSVATGGATLEDDLPRPGWWLTDPPRAAAPGGPFEHDSRAADVARVPAPDAR